MFYPISDGNASPSVFDDAFALHFCLSLQAYILGRIDLPFSQGSDTATVDVLRKCMLTKQHDGAALASKVTYDILGYPRAVGPPDHNTRTYNA